MAILNQGLEWVQISRDPGIVRAFRGVPVKTLVPAGTMLCRFITTESAKKGIRGNQTFFSPWWMDWKTTAAMLAKWRTQGAAAKDVIRARLAVTKEFSQELDSLVQIILTKPVYAWKGTAQYQNDGARGVTYIGGGEQFYLPNLASDSQGLSSDVAYLHCFTAVESLE
jgi:hypothetical protein